MTISGRWVLRFPPKHKYFRYCEKIIVLPTTINPYLIHAKYFSEPWYEEVPLLLPFDDLFTESSKVIFYTYLKQISLSIGKCIVKLYTVPEDNGNAVPATAPEMEIRFIGSRQSLEPIIKSKARRVADINTLMDAMKWTNMLDLAKQLADSAKKGEELTKTYGVNLNAYIFMKKEGLIKDKIEEYEEILEIITHYDEAIIKLAKQVCTCTDK